MVPPNFPMTLIAQVRAAVAPLADLNWLRAVERYRCCGFGACKCAWAGMHKIAGASCAFYDPLQQRGEVPLAREQRRLAAILAADVVAYSHLMERDRSAPTIVQGPAPRRQ